MLFIIHGRMVGWFIFGEVRVIPPHKVDALLLLSLLYVLFVVASQFHMGSDVMGYAQQSAVVHVVGQPLHLLNGSARLNGDDMVAVNARRYYALLYTFLAQSASPSPHLHLHASFSPPPLVVQQPLISWVSAHIQTEIIIINIIHSIVM